MVPRKRSGLAEVFVDDECIVYDAAHDAAHLLNPSAAQIWALLDGRRDAAALVGELAEAYPHAAPQLPQDLEDVLELLDRLHQLAGEGDEGEPEERGDSCERARGAATDIDTSDLAVSGPYDALGFRFDVAARPAVLTRIDATLSGLRFDGEAEHRLAVLATDDGDDVDARLLLDGVVLRSGTQHDATAFLLWEVNQRA